jgi:hypothetical protein
MKNKATTQRKMTRSDYLFAAVVTTLACAIILIGVFSAHLWLIGLGFAVIPPSFMFREAWLRKHGVKLD